MKKITLITAVTLFCSFTIQKDGIGPNNYVIYDAKTGSKCNVEAIVTEMKNYDVLFFGEEHNDSVAHFLQQEILKALYASYGQKLALSMEMFETDCQLVLDEYLEGYIREKNFKKEARSWSNYKDYRPLVEFAKENKLKVVAANSPARYNNMASRNGQKSLQDLSKLAKFYLPPLPYDTMTGAYYEKFTSLMKDDTNAGIPSKDSAAVSSHPVSSMMPKYILHSQSLWDATMAYSISKLFKGDKGAKVLQLNGRFHSDQKYGIVTQLRKYNPKVRVLVISCSPAGDKISDSSLKEEDKILGDYVIYTDPDVPRTFEQ